MTPVDAGKRLVIVGATGMVGGYALRYALDHAAVGGVTWSTNLSEALAQFGGEQLGLLERCEVTT